MHLGKQREVTALFRHGERLRELGARVVPPADHGEADTTRHPDLAEQAHVSARRAGRSLEAGERVRAPAGPEVREPDATFHRRHPQRVPASGGVIPCLLPQRDRLLVVAQSLPRARQVLHQAEPVDRVPGRDQARVRLVQPIERRAQVARRFAVRKAGERASPGSGQVAHRLVRAVLDCSVCEMEGQFLHVLLSASAVRALERECNATMQESLPRESDLTHHDLAHHGVLEFVHGVAVTRAFAEQIVAGELLECFHQFGLGQRGADRPERLVARTRPDHRDHLCHFARSCGEAREAEQHGVPDRSG